MLPRFGRGVYKCTLGLVCLAASVHPASAQSVVKVAYFNIQSGKGEPGLPGHPVYFTENQNCTDTTQPLNAWGVGFIQKALLETLSDPSVIALGLTEAWVCGSPENVRKALGWKARSSEVNGVGMVARYGFAGPERWQQLDTSLNPNPADTMWVLRLPVCLNAACTQSMPVYVGHFYATGVNGRESYDRQAQQAVAFLQSTTSGEPHVFGGDLNIFEGGTKVCEQWPNNHSLSYLRDAGYMDGWTTVHGAAEGYTGMTNRVGCGIPEGYTWKRIDYVWTRPDYLPIAMERFAVVPGGDPSPSDHFGIIATFPYPGTPPPQPDPNPDPNPNPDPPPLTTDDIVLYARRTTSLSGSWTIVDDATAAGGARVAQPDARAPKIASAAATPTDYFELTFTPEAKRAYHLWIRGRAQNDSWTNDSVFVQFSGSVNASGTPVYRIGTTAATMISLEEDAGAGLSGWGWQDNGYGMNVLGPALYFDGTPQTLRVQTREDGVSIDQIVLSPVQYATVAPGTAKNDTHILAETGGAPPPPTINLDEILLHASAASVMGTFRRFADASAADGTAVGTADAALAKVYTPLASPADYVELTFQAKANTGYRLWMRGKAQNDSWANDSVYVQFSNSVDAAGQPKYRIGTTSGASVNLEDGAGVGVSGWGWQDNGYGVSVLGPLVYFAADGPQTLRVQVREDGLSFDQIVLSSQKYLTTAPGALKNDTTIVK